MKCPQCGADNKSLAVSCYRCGYLFRDPVKNAGSSQQMWAKPPKEETENKVRYRRRNQYSNKPTDKEPFVAINDEAQDVFMDGEGRFSPTNAEKLQQLGNGRTVRLVVPAEKQKKRRVDPVRLGLTLLLTALVLFGLVFGIVKLTQTVSAKLEKSRLEEALAAQPQEPMVEQVLIDGAAWHRITFYGQDNERILITEPKRTLTIHAGTAELLLQDSDYIPQEPDVSVDAVDVRVQATLFTEEGEERAIAVPPFSVEIPMSELTVIAPQEQSITTNENKVTVTLKVVPGSRVIIGPHNVTDRVNNDGIVTQSVETTESGTIAISVETKNHRRHEYNIIVTRAPMDVSIAVDDSTVTSTEDGAVVISGQTEAGAHVSTDSAIQEEAIEMEAGGRFRFTAKLNRYGTNTINITSTMPDGRTATLAYSVERQPNLDSYTRAAWALDYPQLLATADKQMGQVYLCVGTVTKQTDSILNNEYLFDVGTDVPKLLVIQYDGSLGLAVGKSYRLYADVNGVKDGYPFLVARYAYGN